MVIKSLLNLASGISDRLWLMPAHEISNQATGKQNTMKRFILLFMKPPPLMNCGTAIRNAA
jgi:hypothetical protein